jgi:hypothetical protein
MEQLGSNWTGFGADFTFDYIFEICKENSRFVKMSQE